MAPRKSRCRKTADKMASYKAAASRKMRSPQKSSQRTSPRTRKSMARVPDLSQGSEQNNEDLHERIAMVHDSSPDVMQEKGPEKEGNPNQPNHPVSQDLSRDGTAFDFDEAIPETPPRQFHVQVRKRVAAPMDGDRYTLFADLKENRESGKPSKKRKLFRTHSRGDGSSTTFRNHGPRTVSHREPGHKSGGSSTPSSATTGLGSDPYVSDTRDRDMDDDELVDHPLPSEQKSLFPTQCRFSSFADDRSRPGSLIGPTRRGVRRDMEFGAGTGRHTAGDSASLDMITISSATMKRFFEGFTKKVTAETEDMRIAHMREIRKVSSALQESVSGEVRSVHGIVEMMSAEITGNATVRTGGKPTMGEWEKKMDGLTPFATFIFGKDIISRILGCNVPFTAVEVYDKYERAGITDVERASLSAQTLMFSLQPRDKKYHYSGDIGKLHSDFKFGVVQNAFFNVCRDSFGQFKTPTNSPEQAGAQQVLGNDVNVSGAGCAKARIVQPSWLADGSITIDHVSQARNFIETLGQTRKDKIRQTPTPDDISCHGALCVYRQLGGRLHHGRGNLRVAFFVGVGYLLVPWNNRIVDINQKSLRLSFIENENMSLSLKDIPMTEHCHFDTESSKVAAADAKNKIILRNLFSDWPGMVLTAQHDVLITKSNPGQNRTAQSEGKKIAITRLVNLIDVAVDCCVEFCRVGSRELFLRTHGSALRCVMLLALLFKALCLEAVEMCDPNASSAANMVPEPTDVKVYGSFLKDFIPGIHTQKTLMSQKCLHMPQSIYDDLNY